MALSSDGDTLAVGAPLESSNAVGIGGDQTNNGAEFSGAVYVFARNEDTWSQHSYIKASNTNGSDWFGFSVSLSGDGNTLAVGAPLEGSNAVGIDGDPTNNDAGESGAAYVFARNAGSDTWGQQAYVKASNTDAGDRFGENVSLSADGGTLVVGAPFEDSNAVGIGGNQVNNSAGASGAVFVFTRSGDAWSQQAYVKASNTDSGDQFGGSTSLSDDGSTFAVGAPNESSNTIGIGGDQMNNDAGGSGAVYVFTRSGNAWSQQAYAKASNTDAGDQFGGSTSLSADGSTLAVGARLEDGASAFIEDSGAVYVFTRSADAWSQQAYVKASSSDFFGLVESGDQFGESVSLSADGSTLAAGAYLHDDRGIVCLFTRAADTWEPQPLVRASAGDTADFFGGGVLLSTLESALSGAAIVTLDGWEHAGRRRFWRGQQRGGRRPRPDD